jgi:hypothetical protein
VHRAMRKRIIPLHMSARRFVTRPHEQLEEQA